jgi:hypothetical protein
MRPPFAALERGYHSSDPAHPSYLDGRSVYARIGLDLDAFVGDDPAYVNTCAVRMSIALLEAGVRFAGRIRIRSGPHRGQHIEPGAKLLADQLARPAVFDRPEFLEPASASRRIAARRGLIFFHKIRGYGGGHLDLIEPRTRIPVCASHCYFDCKEVWFWELDGSAPRAGARGPRFPSR